MIILKKRLENFVVLLYFMTYALTLFFKSNNLETIKHILKMK